MFDPAQVPDVTADELLARFVYSSSHIRKSDLTVKPDAFIPHPYDELSMTRHLQATVEEIWHEGNRIAVLRQKAFYGRADVVSQLFIDQDIAVQAAPIPENPNHANAVGWPADKPIQKMKALLIAGAARYVAHEPNQ